MRAIWLPILSVALGVSFMVGSCGGEFVDLGVPVKKAMILNHTVGPDENGEMTKLYVAFNQEGPALLVQIDPFTGESRQFMPKRGDGPWGLSAGPDDKIYMGTCGYEGGLLLQFDPANPDEGVRVLGKPAESETYIWQLTVGKDSRTIYGCTYPQAKLVSYDTATGQMTDHGRMCETEMYARTIATGENGWIYIGIGTQVWDVVAFNPETGEHHSVTAEWDRDEADIKSAGCNVWNTIGADVWDAADDGAIARIGTQWCRLVDGKAIPVEEEPARSNPPLRDGRIVTSVDLEGEYTLKDPETGEETTHEFEYESLGAGIFVVCPGPGDKIYGGTAMPLRLFRHDPETGESIDLGNPTETEGEIYSMTVRDGKLWVCAYGGAYLSVYDPEKPWEFGKEPGDNPRGYGYVGDGHLRPRAMLVGPENLIYIGSHPPYGTLGGAMAVFDPDKWEVVENYRHLVQNQSINALAYDEGSGLIFGGSTIVGGGGAETTEKEAVFFIWDPVKKEKIHQMVPVEGDTTMASMIADNGRIYFITVPSNTLSVWDLSEERIVGTTKIEGDGVCEASLGMHNNTLYTLTTTAVLSINPDSLEVSEVARPEEFKITTAGATIAESGIYFGSGNRLKAYRW